MVLQEFTCELCVRFSRAKNLRVTASKRRFLWTLIVNQNNNNESYIYQEVFLFLSTCYNYLPLNFASTLLFFESASQNWQKWCDFPNFDCTKNEVWARYADLVTKKCDQIRSVLRIWSNLLSLMENFIFCAVFLFLKSNLKVKRHTCVIY